jgi:adenine phosphoribosyltransferase
LKFSYKKIIIKYKIKIKEISMDLLKKIRTVPDFPKKGILFYDVTTLFKDTDAFSYAVEKMIEPFKNENIEIIVSVESRGFILGAAASLLLQAGFVPIRKKGKLPYKTISSEYLLEYGKDSIEVHQDALDEKKRVLIIDDVIATGGTMEATKNLMEQLSAEIIGFSFLIELVELKGIEKLKPYRVETVLKV